VALKTLGTNATTSLNGFLVGFNDTIAADLAAINTGQPGNVGGIRSDPPGWSPLQKVGSTGLVTGAGTVRVRMNQAYVKQGILIIPNRGRLQLVPGDFVCWDTTTGWPIVISGDAAASGPYTHT
jgi:hypothetical protein